MANDVNAQFEQPSRDQYRVTRTHEGPMGSLDEGATLHVDKDDPRIPGMVEAGMIELLRGDDNSEISSRKAAAAKRQAERSGDSAAK